MKEITFERIDSDSDDIAIVIDGEYASSLETDGILDCLNTNEVIRKILQDIVFPAETE